MTRNENAKRLMYALSDVDETFIEEASRQVQVKKNIYFKPAFAAMLAAACAFLFVLRIRKPNDSDMEVSPFTEVSTMEEAQEITGFTLSVPDFYDKQEITVIDGTIIEVRSMSADEETYITIRKAEGNDDISGDYNEYENTVTETIDSCEVTLSGDGSTWSKAVWTQDEYTYSVYASEGLTMDEMTDIISQTE